MKVMEDIPTEHMYKDSERFRKTTSKIILSSMKWEAGSHIGFNGNIFSSIYQGVKWGMYSIQIYLGSSKAYNRSSISIEDMEMCAGILSKFPMNLFVHTSLVYNLAGKKDILAWNGNYEQDSVTQRVVNGLQYELTVLSTILSGVDENVKKRAGVVVHPGNHINREKGLKAIAKTIDKIEFVGEAKLLLENASGGGTKLATTFEEIRTIIDHVDKNKRKHIGVCVDTAHIFGYGSYDLRKISEVDRMFDEFDEVLGAERFTLLHLNDSQCSDEKRNDAPFGSCKDCHQLLGHGYIWGNGNIKPLIHLLDKCNERNIPIILETHPCDMGTLLTLSKV